ncbi:hypothetical protein [Kumtagia ephedrae]|uniref:hypothetical protein n=1 Tax=Kumtagia ephedrae TaxID=2116701 RepID=UPI0010573313|nr:hypothetical protein [Mesorhizobium ephedrae]
MIETTGSPLRTAAVSIQMSKINDRTCDAGKRQSVVDPQERNKQSAGGAQTKPAINQNLHRTSAGFQEPVAVAV